MVHSFQARSAGCGRRSEPAVEGATIPTRGVVLTASKKKKVAHLARRAPCLSPSFVTGRARVGLSKPRTRNRNVCDCTAMSTDHLMQSVTKQSFLSCCLFGRIAALSPIGSAKTPELGKATRHTKEFVSAVRCVSNKYIKPRFSFFFPRTLRSELVKVLTSLYPALPSLSREPDVQYLMVTALIT